MNLNYVEINSNGPFYNLAFEEHLHCNRKDCGWIMLWQNSPTVVGLNQNTNEEINRRFTEEHGINVVLRTTVQTLAYSRLCGFSLYCVWPCR